MTMGIPIPLILKLPEASTGPLRVVDEPIKETTSPSKCRGVLIAGPLEYYAKTDPFTPPVV
jgi:hypothetical protein